MVVQVLADEGVDTIFGYSGGAILPIYDAVFRYNQDHQAAMPLVVPANEQAAGFMAAGFARASGRVGVALVTSGPGATNTVTPVRDSQADSVPIVVICGQVATKAIGTDAFQEAPVPSIMGAVAKHVFLVTDPDQARGDGAYRVRDRADRAPGSRGARYSEGRAKLEGRVSGFGQAADPGLSAAHDPPGGEQIAGCRMRCVLRGVARREAPADLRGRRGHQCRRLAAPCASSQSEFAVAGGHDADGHRRHRYHGPACPCACSACTARRSRTTRSRTAIS